MNFHPPCGLVSTVGRPKVTLEVCSFKLLQFRDIAIFHSLQTHFARMKNYARTPIRPQVLKFPSSRTYRLIVPMGGTCSAFARNLLTWDAIFCRLQKIKIFHIFHSSQLKLTQSKNRPARAALPPFSQTPPSVRPYHSSLKTYHSFGGIV